MKNQALATMLAGLFLFNAPAHSETSIGVISYWSVDSGAYAKLPDNSVALVNPDNGIFVSAGQTTTLSPAAPGYKPVVKAAALRDITMLGYVPTGYFNHGCDAIGQCQTWGRIEAQVRTYFQTYPRLTGIFFDEAAPSNWDCHAFVAEYQRLRDIVYRHNPRATIAFNAGVPDNCAVAGAEAGDILVLFENSAEAYAAQANNVAVSTMTALSKGVTPWHLIHSVRSEAALSAVVDQAASTHVDLLYVTDIGGDWQNGDNTWGSLPSYWDQELALIDGLALRNLPPCSAFPATTDLVMKVNWEDISKFGYLYLQARDGHGRTLDFDGRAWSVYRGGAPAVFGSQALTGALRIDNSVLQQAMGALPAGVRGVSVSYAATDALDERRGRTRVCKGR